MLTPMTGRVAGKRGRHNGVLSFRSERGLRGIQKASLRPPGWSFQSGQAAKHPSSLSFVCGRFISKLREITSCGSSGAAAGAGQALTA